MTSRYTDCATTAVKFINEIRGVGHENDRPEVSLILLNFVNEN
jgi:hypothetical protein